MGSKYDDRMSGFFEDEKAIPRLELLSVAASQPRGLGGQKMK